MLTLSLSRSSLCHDKQFLSFKTPDSHKSRAFSRVSHPVNVIRRLEKQQQFVALGYNPLRVSTMSKRRRGFGVVCYSAPLTPRNLQWVSTIATSVLMLARGTAIHKAFLVPLFALQAPASIVSWMKGEYGVWVAFLALLVRLFFYIPGQLELPFIALLLVIVSPYQAMRLRGTKEGVILSLIIAGYLAFQHFVRAGSLGKAFEQGSILATIATICIVAVPCLLLFI